MRRAVAVVLAGALAAAGCDGERKRPEPGGGAVFALLADNRLLKVSLNDGRVLFERRLAPRPESIGAGRYLALSRDENTVFALVRSREIAAVDVASGDVRQRLRLPRGVAFGAIAVGPKTGRLHVFGNRAGRTITIPVLDEQRRELSVVVAVLHPDTGDVLARETVRAAQGLDWAVYAAAVSQDERRLFVSYHGSSTGGVDWIDVSSGGFDACRPKAPWRGGACVARAHGAVESYGEGFIAATGHEPVIEVGGDAAVRRVMRTRLKQTHLMEFGLDRERDRLWAIGSCYVGVPGVSAVDLETGRARLLVPPQRSSTAGDLPEACGDRIAVAPGPMLVLARTTAAAAAVRWPGKLVFLDGRSGRIVRTVETPAEPVDVLVVD